MGWMWIFSTVTTLLLVAAALRWGAGPERICVAVIIATNVGDHIYHFVVARDAIYTSVDIGHLVPDLFAAAIFTGVALRANRVYPLWISAFQFVSVISHFVREVDGHMGILAYAMMNYMPANFILLIMAGGIWAHARREKRYGPYRQWRTSSNPLPGTSPKSPPTG